MQIHPEGGQSPCNIKVRVFFTHCATSFMFAVCKAILSAILKLVSICMHTAGQKQPQQHGQYYS